MFVYNMIYVGAVDGLGAEVVEALVVPALRTVRRDRHHHLPPTAAPRPQRLRLKLAEPAHHL